MIFERKAVTWRLVLGAPVADPEVSVSLRGRCATECRLGVRKRGIRKSLDGLELCHGPRISGGDPGLRAVDGSDPPIRHASYGHGDGWDVRGHPTPRLGSLPSISPLREGCGDRAGLVPVLLDDVEQPDRPAGR